MNDLFSSASVPAMIESWRQHKVSHLTLILPAGKLSIRTLTDKGKGAFRTQFAGEIDLPWFVFCRDEKVLLIADNLKILLKELREAGYRVYDLSQLK